MYILRFPMRFKMRLSINTAEILSANFSFFSIDVGKMRLRKELRLEIKYTHAVLFAI